MGYAYTNGTILDGTWAMEPLEGMALLQEGEKIVDIVPADRVPQGFAPIDLSGAYLLPGLVNLHVHLAMDGRPPKASKRPVDYARLYHALTSNALLRAAARRRVAGFARTELMSGVTTIRTVGGVLDFDARVRDEIDAGRLVGPRILASNMGISVPGGHFAGSIATEADSPLMAVEHVDKIAQTKPNLIKLMVTGGVMDASEEGEPGVLRMPPEVVRAACDEAHRLGFRVAAHVESSEGVRVALEGGVDTIEHGAPLDAHAIALFKRRGAADVCTISPALPYAEFDLGESHAQPVAKRNGRIVMDGIVACARTCLAEGIPVGLGNDVSCPFVTHYNFWRELCYFHRYVGASNAQTLHLATLGNAAIAGVSDVTGSLEPGKSADLLVVGSNPLEDLSALRDVRMVALRGRLQRHPRVRRYAEVDALLDRYM